MGSASTCVVAFLLHPCQRQRLPASTLPPPGQNADLPPRPPLARLRRRQRHRRRVGLGSGRGACGCGKCVSCPQTSPLATTHLPPLPHRLSLKKTWPPPTTVPPPTLCWPAWLKPGPRPRRTPRLPRAPRPPRPPWRPPSPPSSPPAPRRAPPVPWPLWMQTPWPPPWRLKPPPRARPRARRRQWTRGARARCAVAAGSPSRLTPSWCC